MDYKIESSTKEDMHFVGTQLIKFNESKIASKGTLSRSEINYHIKDEDGNIIAGIIATDYTWKVIFIDVLWIDEKHRKQGLGSLLLNKLEDVCRKNDYTMIHLDTFDFQAKDFYMKNGYEIFGVLEDCPEGHNRYYMKKNLR